MRPALVLALTSCVAFGALVSPASGGGPFPEPKCRATTALDAAQRLAFRVRCNFEATDISLATSAPVHDVRRQLKVTRADPGDAFRCRQPSERRIKCRGRAGKGATVRGAFSVNVDPCAVSTRFEVFGGLDCDGRLCPAIGFQVNKRDKQPAGC